MLLVWYLLVRILSLVCTVMEYTMGFSFILNVVFYYRFDSYYWVKDSLLEPPPERQ